MLNNVNLSKTAALILQKNEPAFICVSDKIKYDHKQIIIKLLLVIYLIIIIIFVLRPHTMLVLTRLTLASKQAKLGLFC